MDKLEQEKADFFADMLKYKTELDWAGCLGPTGARSTAGSLKTHLAVPGSSPRSTHTEVLFSLGNH